MAEDPEVSVLLLTYNGARYLREVLALVGRQSLPAREIIAIDSGSTDETVDILCQGGAQVHRIAKADFSHSRTRNAAVRLARSRYVVFLTQDATPADAHWLRGLLEPFRLFANVAASFSRHLARPGGDLLEAHDLRTTFGTIRHVKEMPHRASLFRQDLWHYIHFSNSSSAYDRELLLANPFDESLRMAEDQEWAKRMLTGGFRLVYEPASAVLHSHDHTLGEKRRRHADMGQAFSQFLSAELGPRPLPWRPWLFNVLLDVAYLARADAPLRRRLKWLLRSPIDRAVTHHAYCRAWNRAHAAFPALRRGNRDAVRQAADAREAADP